MRVKLFWEKFHLVFTHYMRMSAAHSFSVYVRATYVSVWYEKNMYQFELRTCLKEKKLCIEGSDVLCSVVAAESMQMSRKLRSSQ